MALWPFTVNGVTFNYSDFDGLAYLTGIPNSMEQAIRAVSKDSIATASNSLSIGLGAKALTGITNKLFSVGDHVLLIGNSSNWAAGEVTAYNSSTGAMTVNVTSIVGAGSFSFTVIRIGEDSIGVSSPVPTYLGGTGAAGVHPRLGASFSSQFSSVIGGLNAVPSDSAVELFDDFEAFIQPNSTYPTKHSESPWYTRNLVINERAAPSTSLISSFFTQMCGWVNLQVSNANLLSGYMSYGQKGYLLAGDGTLNFWALVAFNPGSAGKPCTYRIGLRGNGSGQSNIFNFSGIGFEIGANNKVSVFVGNSGDIFRQLLPASVVPELQATTWYRFGIQVSADGNLIRFFIGNSLLLEKQIKAPSDRIENMMHPAFQIQATGNGSLYPSLFIDAVWLRKNLAR